MVLKRRSARIWSVYYNHVYIHREYSQARLDIVGGQLSAGRSSGVLVLLVARRSAFSGSLETERPCSSLPRLALSFKCLSNHSRVFISRVTLGRFRPCVDVHVQLEFASEYPRLSDSLSRSVCVVPVSLCACLDACSLGVYGHLFSALLFLPTCVRRLPFKSHRAGALV